MELQVKTPVQVVQELIALHTNRIEAGERLSEKQPAAAAANQMTAAIQQSKQFTQELMDELSGFGDAVQGDTDKENDYHAIWEKSLADIDTMDAQQAEQVFQMMENSLNGIYQDYLKTETELPVSLHELLQKHAGEIK